jgi:methylmalonyl-CoA mutase
MSDKSNALFSEFDGITKVQWLKRIEKDLKGRDMHELDWQLPHLTISPFAHIQDFEGQLPTPITQINSEKNRWDVVANIRVNIDEKQANKQALSALMGGANALCFFVDDYPKSMALNILLDTIELDYIATFFSEKTANKNPLSFLKSFYDIAKSTQKDPKLLRGGIHYDPFADGRHDLKATTDLLLWTQEHLPQFKVIIVQSAPFFKGSENVVEELTSTLNSVHNYLNKLINKDLDIKIIIQYMAFNCTIGTSYFVEIAKLRALKLLWGNLLAGYDTPSVFPTIYATIPSATSVDDSNNHKICATTQAMSAIIGGVNALAIDTLEEETAFHQRIGLNTQHLLQMESYFDQVQDPAAGSYYIEKLTSQIAEKTWERFRNL